MAFDHLSRAERRRLVHEAKQNAIRRPAALTDVPVERWPPAMRFAEHPPMRVIESREYLVQIFPEGEHYGGRCVRLSVNRVTLAPSGRWQEGITWDELMQIKRDAGYAESYAVEVYPPDQFIVNDAAMRHLWVLQKSLTIGWLGDNP